MNTDEQNNANEGQSRAGEAGANLTAVLEVVPPVCWYIDFGRYGQITMRQDDAQMAADDGARVWLYEPGTLVTSNASNERPALAGPLD